MNDLKRQEFLHKSNRQWLIKDNKIDYSKPACKINLLQAIYRVNKLATEYENKNNSNAVKLRKLEADAIQYALDKGLIQYEGIEGNSVRYKGKYIDEVSLYSTYIPSYCIPEIVEPVYRFYWLFSYDSKIRSKDAVYTLCKLK